MPVRLVVTDMDNTLYSWVDYIVPAMEALVAAVCQATGYPRIRVVQSLKTVYSKYESNEYPFALQESSIYAEFPEFGSFDKLIIEPARMAFAEARKKYMKPYKGVIETLEALKERKIPVVALTDAPRNPAEQRAKRMGFDQFLGSLYTLPGFQLPATPEGQALVAPDILQKEERGHYRAACPVIELPRDYEKPNPKGLMQICRTYSVDPKEVLVIGDSVNLGARLESLNKEYATRIIISEATREALPGRYHLRPLGDVVVKGKTRPVKIFEVKENQA